MAPPSDAEILKVCAKVQATDDRLGQRSDHEGDENGPTWHLWQMGFEKFDRIAQEQINTHARAMYQWRKLQRMNARRKK